MSRASERIDRQLCAPDPSEFASLYTDPLGPSNNSVFAFWDIPRCQLWTIRSADALIGAAWFRSVLDEVELLDVRLLANYRGQGFGCRLLEEAHASLQHEGARCCHLEVREGNTRAQRLYQRLGYEVSGKRANYYRGALAREDAILMTKTFL